MKKQTSNKKPVVILGAGGHARVLQDCLALLKRKVLDVCEDDRLVLKKYKPQKVELVLGIGSVGDTQLRRDVFKKFKSKGFVFASVIHPSAVVAADVILGDGVQIMAGVVVQTGTKLEDNVLVNTRSSIDHDSLIGAHVHIAPGVTLSGGVTIGKGSHVGVGVTVIQGVTVGENCLVRAGSVITKNFHRS